MSRRIESILELFQEQLEVEGYDADAIEQVRRHLYTTMPYNLGHFGLLPQVAKRIYQRRAAQPVCHAASAQEARPLDFLLQVQSRFL
jgi:hypothetical protein